MDRTRIKICGITSPAAALAAADAGADAIGLVFVRASPRFIEEVEEARSIVSVLPPFVTPIALFANAPLELVRQTTEELDIHTVQLHGRETTDYVAELAPLHVIKAIGFDPKVSTKNLTVWKSLPNVTALLWDRPSPNPGDSAALTGGFGKPFDWQALAQLKFAGELVDLPAMILAGGLNPTNVADAVRLLRPWAVDVSSGVEQERGVKDPAKIRAFCAAVREA